MAEFFFPAGVGVQDESITLVDDQSFTFRPQFNRGAIQVQNFGGPRVKLQRQCFVSGADRGALLAWLSQVRGKSLPFWTGINYKARGSFPATELLANPDWSNGTTSWTLNNCTATGRKGQARAVRTAGSFYIYQSVGLTSGVSYMLRSAATANKPNSMGANLASVTDYVSAATARISTSVYTAASTAGFNAIPMVGDAATTDMVNGDWVDLAYATCQRVALVNGAGQTGSRVNVKGLPISTAGLILAGDIVEVNRQLVIATNDLGSDGSGNGTLVFEPEMIASPPDGDPVVIGAPMGKFLLAADPQIVNQFGAYATVTLDMEQVY